MKDERLTVRLTKEELSLLKEISLHEQVSESEILRKALRKYVAAHQQQVSCYELAQQLGILGVATEQDLPDDLSTNQKYFEGFGK